MEYFKLLNDSNEIIAVIETNIAPIGFVKATKEEYDNFQPKKVENIGYIEI